MNQFKNNIIKGIASDSIIFALTIIISFSIIPIYLKFISLEEFGIFLSIQGIIAIVSLADIGLPLYTLKILSNDKFFNSSKLIEYLNSAQIFQYVLALGLLLIGYIVYLYIDSLLSFEKSYSQISKDLFFYSWLSVVVGVVCGLNHSILKSRHELKYLNIALFMIIVLTNTFNVLFLLQGFDISYFGISLLISTVIINIVMSIKVYMKYKVILFFPKQFHKSYIKEGWTYIKQFQLLRIAQVSKTSLFTVLMSNYVGQVIVATYNISNKVSGLIPGFMSKIIMNLFPSISSLFGRNEIDEVSKYYEKVFKFGIIFTFFCIISLFFLNEVFIELWVGKDKFIGIEIFIFILLNFFIMAYISFTGIIIQASGKFEKIPFYSILEVIVFLILSFVFFKFYGLIGFFVGYIVSSCISIVYYTLVINKILNINILEWILDCINILLFLVISMFSINYLIDLLAFQLHIKFICTTLLFILCFILVIKIGFKINLEFLKKDN